MTELCTRKIHRCFIASSNAMLSWFDFQPNMLPISMINKQSGCDLLEHRVSSQLPHCPYGLFFPFYLLSENFTFSLSPPLSHVHKPTLNLDLEQEVFSAAIVMFPYESSSLQSGGVRQDEGRERHVGALQSRCEQCYGNSTLWLHLWKTDLWVITLNSWWVLLHGGSTVWKFRHSSSRYNRGLCMKMENTLPYHSLALEMTAWHTVDVFEIFFPATTICWGLCVFTMCRHYLTCLKCD